MDGQQLCQFKKKLTSINHFWQDRAAGIRSTGQNIFRVLRQKTVHNHVQNRPPLASSWNHPNSVHTLKTPLKSTLILSLYQFLGHKGGLFPSGFATKVSWIQLQLKGHSMSAAQTAYPKLPSTCEGRLFQTKLCNGDNKFTAYGFIVTNAITKLSVRKWLVTYLSINLLVS